MVDPHDRKPHRFDILIVDDDPTMCDLLRIHLTDAGYNVRTTEDAIECGKELLRKRPDLLISDISMPFMSGLELLQAVRQDPTVAPVRVIVLSSSTEDRNRERASALGVEAFLAKPVMLNELLATVAQVLGVEQEP